MNAKILAWYGDDEIEISIQHLKKDLSIRTKIRLDNDKKLKLKIDKEIIDFIKGHIKEENIDLIIGQALKCLEEKIEFEIINGIKEVLKNIECIGIEREEENERRIIKLYIKCKLNNMNLKYFPEADFLERKEIKRFSQLNRWTLSNETGLHYVEKSNVFHFFLNVELMWFFKDNLKREKELRLKWMYK